MSAKVLFADIFVRSNTQMRILELYARLRITVSTFQQICDLTLLMHPYAWSL